MSSIVTFASAATTSPSAVITSGFTSTSMASVPRYISYAFAISAPTALCSSFGTPAAYSRRRTKYGCSPIARVQVDPGELVGMVDATASMSMPPIVESMNRFAFAPRSNVIEK